MIEQGLQVRFNPHGFFVEDMKNKGCFIAKEKKKGRMLAMVQKETSLQIKCLRSDGGGEYLSNEFARFLQEHGIKQQYSCSHIPQRNGIAERENMHIGEVSRAMLNEKGLLDFYWIEAIATAVYIMDMTPRSKDEPREVNRSWTWPRLRRRVLLWKWWVKRRWMRRFLLTRRDRRVFEYS